MKQIEVLDAIMGSGKTTGIIQWMLDNFCFTNSVFET